MKRIFLTLILLPVAAQADNAVVGMGACVTSDFNGASITQCNDGTVTISSANQRNILICRPDKPCEKLPQ